MHLTETTLSPLSRRRTCSAFRVSIVETLNRRGLSQCDFAIMVVITQAYGSGILFYQAYSFNYLEGEKQLIKLKQI